MTRMEIIEGKYLTGELSRDQALAQLEALGMWEDDAAEYLSAAPALSSQKYSGEIS